METVRAFLVNITLVRDGLTLVRKGPTTWTVRGEDFVKSLPAYRQYTKNVFAYAKSVAQGPQSKPLRLAGTCLTAWTRSI